MDLVIATQHQRLCQRLAGPLTSHGHQVTVVETPTELLRACLRGAAELALVDMDLGPLPEVELIGLLREVDDRLMVVPLVGANHAALEFSIRSLGVFYYMLKPVDPDELLALIDSASRRTLAAV